MTRWKCRKCWYVYDPRVGDPDGGIAPGTPFEKIPDDWRCPVCGATKGDFYVLSPEPTAAPERAPRPAPAPPAARQDAPEPLASPLKVSRPPSARPLDVPMWTVGSLKGLRQGHDQD